MLMAVAEAFLSFFTPFPAVACFPALSGLRLAVLGTCRGCRQGVVRSGRAADFAVVPLTVLLVGKVILREIIVVSNTKIRCFLVFIMGVKGYFRAEQKMPAGWQA